ncbi:hypothetical protein FKM82_021396 [Ascaphus truei]
MRLRIRYMVQRVYVQRLKFSAKIQLVNKGYWSVLYKRIVGQTQRLVEKVSIVKKIHHRVSHIDLSENVQLFIKRQQESHLTGPLDDLRHDCAVAPKQI